jgi:hypothetical protein
MCKLPDPYSIPTSTSSQNPSSTPWTRAKLEKERRDWWDTRDTGSREIWEAYRQMVAHAQRGEMQEAQTLLDATGCTCPTGKLWHGIFDERGVEYAIRDAEGMRNYEWLVFEPVELKEKGAGGCVGGKGLGTTDGQEEEQEDDEEILSLKNSRTDSLDQEKTNAKRKGKQRAEEADREQVLRVRCRLSSTGRDHIVEYRKGNTVGSIMEALGRVTGVSVAFLLITHEVTDVYQLEAKRHRIIYLGRLYSAHESLPTEGDRAWKEYNILTVLVMEGS